jgi:hypothetical protein
MPRIERAAAALIAPLLLSAAAPSGFRDPHPVVIAGYQGDLMEPFVTHDGRYLFFNNRNTPPEQTDLFYAERGADGGWVFKGRLAGANSSALDGVASLDAAGELYFVSTRSYDTTLSTLYRGDFADGRVSHVEVAPGVSPHIPGIVDFDGEISADGQSLYVAEGDFRGSGPSPKTAHIVLYHRDGAGFRRDPGSDALLATVNAGDFSYAPDISSDGRELYFTRISPGASVGVFRATRAGAGEPFGQVEQVAAVDGLAEAPSLSDDGHTLYFHRKVGDSYQLWAVTR